MKKSVKIKEKQKEKTSVFSPKPYCELDPKEIERRAKTLKDAGIGKGIVDKLFEDSDCLI